jgi:hypothetical protein
MPDNTVDLKGKIVAINLMPPNPYQVVSLWQYRYTASAMGQQGREPQPWCCCYHFVADDTVESLISFTDFIIKKEVMELKTANHLLQLRYQLSWQVSS